MLCLCPIFTGNFEKYAQLRQFDTENMGDFEQRRWSRASHYTHLLSISLACVTLCQICLKNEQTFQNLIVFRHLRWNKPLAFVY